MIAGLLNSINCSQGQATTKPKVKKIEVTKEIAEIADGMVKAESSLIEFIRQAWHIVEPKNVFVDGWHLDAICEHLEAVSAGQIQNLLINIPPRHMKSLAVSVFFPAWEWMHNPSLRYVYSSYAEQLSKRDSRKCRKLIQSLWYQSRWGSAFEISSDQNEKLRFENNETGVRVATSVDGMGTGEGGDRIIVDDAHKIKEGGSIVKRMGVLEWWNEEMSTRLDDEDTGVKIIVGQRVHQNDLSGYVLKEEHGYAEVILPARYEGENRIKSPVIDKKTGKPWKDRRTKVGEPLWRKFGIKQLDKRESKMTVFAIASQQQQQPTPRGGGLFKVESFKIEKNFDRSAIVRSVRYWDKAGTKDAGKMTAGVLMHKLVDESHVIENIIRGQWEYPEREKRIRQTAKIDGIEVMIRHEQEGGSGGKESAQSTTKGLSGYKVEADHPTGSKEVRAEPFSSQVSNGSVILIDGAWAGTSVTDYLEELEMFPTGTYSDQVDASAGAFNSLNDLGNTKKQIRSGVWGVEYPN